MYFLFYYQKTCISGLFFSGLSETFLVTSRSPAAMTDSFLQVSAPSWIALGSSVKPLDTLHLPAFIEFGQLQPL